MEFSILIEKYQKIAEQDPKGIDHYIKHNVFPLKYTSLDEFVDRQIEVVYSAIKTKEQFESLWEINRQYNHLSKDECLLRIKNEKYGLRTTLVFNNLFIAYKHREAFRIPPFIPVILKPDFLGWKIFLHDAIFEALVFSRRNFVLNKKHLPIVIYGYLTGKNCNHAISILLLPDEKNLTWNRMLVDSSAASSSPDCKPLLNAVEFEFGKAWTKYKKEIIGKQIQPEKLVRTTCSDNFQQKFGTCGFWSFGLVLNFLLNYQENVAHLSDVELVKLWCMMFSGSIGSSQQDAYLGVIVDYSNIVHTFTDAILYSPLTLTDFSRETFPKKIVARFDSSHYTPEEKIAVDNFEKVIYAIVKKWDLFAVFEMKSVIFLKEFSTTL